VTTHGEAEAEARDRAEYFFTLRTEEAMDESVTAAALSVTDVDGTAMIVEVGAGPNGVYASVSGYDKDEPADLHVFATENQAMLIVERKDE
jgi:hypothetical protein